MSIFIDVYMCIYILRAMSMVWRRRGRIRKEGGIKGMLPIRRTDKEVLGLYLTLNLSTPYLEIKCRK
jgi:hypothetical protein